MKPRTITRRGATFVLVPQAEYRRLVERGPRRTAAPRGRVRWQADRPRRSPLKLDQRELRRERVLRRIRLAKSQLIRHLRDARHSARLTQVQLAQELGYPLSLVRRCESGAVRAKDWYAYDAFSHCERLRLQYSLHVTRSIDARRRWLKAYLTPMSVAEQRRVVRGLVRAGLM
jgi:hypothetical protein